MALVWTSCLNFINEPSVPSFIGDRLTEYLMDKSTQNWHLPLPNQPMLLGILFSLIAILRGFCKTVCKKLNANKPMLLGIKIPPLTFSTSSIKHFAWCCIFVWFFFVLRKYSSKFADKFSPFLEDFFRNADRSGAWSGFSWSSLYQVSMMLIVIKAPNYK